MSYAMVAITVLWTFLFGYLLVASIDFGAGFFSYYSVLTGHENKIHNIIQRYLSPVWEVTNVFLIFLWSDLSDSFRMLRIIMAPPCLCRAAWPLCCWRSAALTTPITRMAARPGTISCIWGSTGQQDCSSCSVVDDIGHLGRRHYLYG